MYWVDSFLLVFNLFDNTSIEINVFEKLKFFLNICMQVLDFYFKFLPISILMLILEHNNLL